MKSLASLRSLAVEAHSGFDLRERFKLTSINSACLAFSCDGTLLAVGEHHGKPDFRVQVFDVASRALLSEYTIRADNEATKQTGVFALAFSPDGRWLAGGFRDGTIVVWAKNRWQRSPTVLGHHKKSCRGLAFTPDGLTLVSGSADGAQSSSGGRRQAGRRRTPLSHAKCSQAYRSVPTDPCSPWDATGSERSSSSRVSACIQRSQGSSLRTTTAITNSGSIRMGKHRPQLDGAKSYESVIIPIGQAKYCLLIRTLPCLIRRRLTGSSSTPTVPTWCQAPPTIRLKSGILRPTSSS